MSFLVDRIHQENFFLNSCFRRRIDRARTCALGFRKWSWRVPPGGPFWGGQWPGKGLASLGSFLFTAALFYRCLTKNMSFLVNRSHQGEFLSQRQLPVLQTTPSHTAAQVHSIWKEVSFFSDEINQKKAKNQVH
ncbi:hypothetical protein CEXT_313341 [Caerostris extrusa]|uniref:Uncharacterized protein n=1 Tax=Caerostris extrusa TaxID=172846 RepID=A0AAV4Y5F7_CAEEX|nr:hypothetical protein CEXT_313341 [Caerostris extrusa]